MSAAWAGMAERLDPAHARLENLCEPHQQAAQEQTSECGGSDPALGEACLLHTLLEEVVTSLPAPRKGA